MKLVFLIGNGAVGKMTVGQELMKLTGLRLFHNHIRNNILAHDQKYRLESYDGEIPYENYIKIDNTNLEPAEAARMIQERFSL